MSALFMRILVPLDNSARIMVSTVAAVIVMVLGAIVLRKRKKTQRIIRRDEELEPKHRLEETASRSLLSFAMRLFRRSS